jgi:hypothetical protein
MTFTSDALTEAAEQATPGPWHVQELDAYDRATWGFGARLVAPDGSTPIYTAGPGTDDAALLAMLSPERILLLAELWKAAEEAVLLEYDGQRSLIENREIQRRAERLRSVLARLAGHDEEPT